MARYEVAVFSFLFLGLFSFLGRVGVTPQVRLKSCQSCVSALILRMFVFWPQVAMIV